MNKIDLTGKTRGKLTILDFAENKGKHLYWNVKCECGKIYKISSTNFINRKTESCGCTRKGKKRFNFTPASRKEKGEGSLSVLINRYKQGAKQRNLSYNLSREEFKLLTKSNCYYCGIEPLQEIKGHRSNGIYIYNGIDRLDNSKGYEYHNCVSACETCNKAKLNHNFNKFLNWLERVANHLLSVGDIQLNEETYNKLEKL